MIKTVWELKLLLQFAECRFLVLKTHWKIQHFSTFSYKKAQVWYYHCWFHRASLAASQAAHWLQNCCSSLQIHSPSAPKIHIRHASRTDQCQTATLQFIAATLFCWTSHQVLNLCWQIIFLPWSENLASISRTYQICWNNRHLQETFQTPSIWTYV